MREVEVKARLANKDEVLRKLEELGVVLGEEVHQVDKVYVPKGKVVPVDHFVNVLRIREQNGKYLFTLKYSVTNGLDKVERELEITDPDIMTQIIEDLGFFEIARVDKLRRKAKYGEWEICVDEVAGLGTFIEVEKMAEDPSAEEVQKELMDFLEKLGVSKDHQVFYGYDVLLYRQAH